MNRSIAKEIRSEIEIAVAKIAKKYKMNLDLGNGTFTSEDFAVRVKLVDAAKTKTSGRNTTMSPAGMFAIYGLPENVIGSTFKHKTKTFTVTEVNPRRPKNCIGLVDQNGKQFKCSLEQYKRMI